MNKVSKLLSQTQDYIFTEITGPLGEDEGIHSCQSSKITQLQYLHC